MHNWRKIVETVNHDGDLSLKVVEVFIFPLSVNPIPDYENAANGKQVVLAKLKINMEKNFVAINYINCTPGYTERFEELFGSRAHAIDTMPGFVDMQVLRPAAAGDAYLIVSFWENENAFKTWTSSPAFIEGHKRGFSDLAKAKAEGRPAPMTSDFKTYEIIAR